ncbi:MAG TPA: hypothetical protein VHB73_04870 [Alphaproteobacteria bacterium]|nr:hypothetical protein [Alphaproteobacteria bacterium]
MRVFLMAAFGVLFSVSAFAQDSCYTPKQFEADRGLRMHADIEVIMLTCKYSTHGQSLQKVYNDFLRRHSKLIRGWENVIAETYGGDGVGRNEAIDNFRTWLANQKGNEAAKMGPKSFCREWADFVPYAASLTDPQIMTYVREPDSARPTKRPPC